MPVRPAALLMVFAAAGPGLAQTVTLAETAKPGDASRYAVDLDLSGQMTVLGDGGKPHQLTLAAKARHRFAERAVAGGAVRHYAEAVASSVVAGEKSDRALPADRRTIVVGPAPYSPAGPLTRDELDLVTDHFDPACLPGLLPGKAVAVGDTWAVGNDAARAAGLFDALSKNALAGKLTAVADGVATFTVTGTAEGIENGGPVTLTVSATGKYHVATGRVVELTWKQTDDRGQGPVSPAAKVEATITLRREVLAAPPAELAEVRAVADPSPDLLALRHADPKGRYALVYPRDWHVTGQTDAHLVLRLLDRGEFVAQATVTAWRKAAAGKHDTPDEFKQALGGAAGWVVDRVTEDGERPTDGGRWLYRVAAEGKMDGAAAVQAFHLVAGPNGDQVVVTVAAPVEKAKALAGRDLGLVGGIRFPK